MPGIMKKSAASIRLFRHRTDNDIFDDKCKRRSFLGRKKIIGRGRSLSRFSTISSDGSREAFPTVSVVSDAASTSASSLESSSVLSDETMVSSTVIDIHDHVEEDDKQNRNSDDDEEHNSSENFFSKLLDLIQCFPHKLEQPDKREIDSNDFVINIMRIECILKQAGDEESDELGPTPSPLNHTRHLSIPPLSEWLQEPLLLVATPGRSDMMIRRIRRVSYPSFFESPTSLHSETIQEGIGQGNLDYNQVIQLPINNGKETDSWVIDFETNLFAGTALFRIRGSKDWNSIQSMTPTKSDSNSMTSRDYFARHNRKFQMVVRGKFKANVVMADCMSGLLLDHHLASSRPANMNCADGLPFSSESDTNEKVDTKNKSKRLRRLKRGKSSTDDSLPPKWALRTAVKIAGVFSPRMDADLESAYPRILSPLCSTAQTISVSRKTSCSTGLDDTHVEPSPRDDASLVLDLRNSPPKKPDSTTTNYVQQRKRVFDAAYDARVESLAQNSGQVDVSPCFDQNAEYTFEFLQHLIDYNDLSLDLGKVLGKVRLGGALRGQPVRFISAVVKQRNCNALAESHLSMNNLDCLWSFDLWHKSLIPGGV